MGDRGGRRDLTRRHAERAVSVYVTFNGAYDLSAHRFAKGKSLGCRCRRRGRGYSPKIAYGFCHGAGHQYHPSVIERIAGRALCRSWLGEVRSADADDVQL